MFKSPVMYPDKSNYKINPLKLRFAEKLLIGEKISKLLIEKNINLELSYSDSEDKTKPVIVLMHGNSSSKKVFEEQSQHFSKNYRVITIDLLGHGDSTKISYLENLTLDEKNQLSEDFYNPAAMIAEVKQLLESRNIQNAHMIGWSLGGHIAYGLAAENKNLVASITTIGSPPVLLSSSGLNKGFGEWFVNNLVPQWVDEPKNYSHEEATKIAEHVGFKPDDKYITHDIMTADPLMRRGLFLRFRDYDHPDYAQTGLNGEALVKKIGIPICLIVGKNDRGVNPHCISSFNNQLMNKHSIVRVVEDAPHAVFVSHPQEFYKIVDEFLESIELNQRLYCTV